MEGTFVVTGTAGAATGIGVGAGAEGAAGVGSTSAASSLKSLNAATLDSSCTIMQTSLPMGTFLVPAGTKILAR